MSVVFTFYLRRWMWPLNAKDKQECISNCSHASHKVEGDSIAVPLFANSQIQITVRRASLSMVVLMEQYY